MRTDELDERRLKPEIDLGSDPVLIALHVEHNAPTFDRPDTWVGGEDVLVRPPLRCPKRPVQLTKRSIRFGVTLSEPLVPRPMRAEIVERSSPPTAECADAIGLDTDVVAHHVTRDDPRRVRLSEAGAYDIFFNMTRLLEQAIETLRGLPEVDQDLAAKLILGFANPDAQRYTLDDRQVAEVELARREVREGRIATDAEMDEVWRRFGR
jgi:hypothetical protein